MVGIRDFLQAAVLAVAVLVAGCDEPVPKQKAERVGAIKPYYVAEPAGDDDRARQRAYVMTCRQPI